MSREVLVGETAEVLLPPAASLNSALFLDRLWRVLAGLGGGTSERGWGDTAPRFVGLWKVSLFLSSGEVGDVATMGPRAVDLTWVVCGFPLGSSFPPKAAGLGFKGGLVAPLVVLLDDLTDTFELTEPSLLDWASSSQPSLLVRDGVRERSLRPESLRGLPTRVSSSPSLVELLEAGLGAFIGLKLFSENWPLLLLNGELMAWEEEKLMVIWSGVLDSEVPRMTTLWWEADGMVRGGEMTAGLLRGGEGEGAWRGEGWGEGRGDLWGGLGGLFGLSVLAVVNFCSCLLSLYCSRFSSPRSLLGRESSISE